MKKLVAITAVMIAALALTGCSGESTNTGTEPAKPAKVTDYFSDTVEIYFTDGQSLKCLSDEPDSMEATLVCNWRSIEAIGNLKIANDSEYEIRYIDYSGESTPCVFINRDTESAAASCGFGVIVK